MLHSCAIFWTFGGRLSALRVSETETKVCHFLDTNPIHNPYYNNISTIVLQEMLSNSGHPCMVFHKQKNRSFLIHFGVHYVEYTANINKGL